MNCYDYRYMHSYKLLLQCVSRHVILKRHIIVGERELEYPTPL